MIKTLYVYFREADHKSWYLRLLDRKFTHCYAYEQQEIGGYPIFIVAESLFNCLSSQVMFGKAEDLPQHDNCERIRIELEVDPERNTLDLMPINCVSLVKKQLGLNKPLIITPKQLYKHLLAIGGKGI